MVRVFWTTTKYRRSEIIHFLIPISAYQFVINSFSYLPWNKRKGSPKSKFFHPLSVDLEMVKKEVDLECYPDFTITEKELVKWIRRLSLDQVRDLNDIDWIIKVKKDYESKDLLGV